jgi:large subunit ribosomal protein L17
MRHRKTGRKLDMDSAQRKSLFRNMATSLVLHGFVRTTVARAKELRPMAEHLLSIGKRAPSVASLSTLDGGDLSTAKADRVSATRQLAAVLESEEAVRKVMTELADRFRARPGGYTRIVKLSRRRPGDNAPMAVIQLVEPYEAPAA